MTDPSQGRDRSSTFTTGPIFYDRKKCCVQLGFVERKITFSFVPIFKDMVGKEPRKGDRFYDYDSRIFFAVEMEKIPVLRRMVEKIESDELDEGILETDTRTFSVYAGGIFDDIDGPSIGVTMRDGGRQIVYSFQSREFVLGVKYDAKGKETPIKEDMCPEWDIFKAFVNTAALLNATAATEHGAAKALGGAPRSSSGGGSTAPPPRRRVGGDSSRIANGTAPEARPAAASPAEFFDEDFAGGESTP